MEKYTDLSIYMTGVLMLYVAKNKLSRICRLEKQMEDACG